MAANHQPLDGLNVQQSTFDKSEVLNVSVMWKFYCQEKTMVLDKWNHEKSDG